MDEFAPSIDPVPSVAGQAATPVIREQLQTVKLGTRGWMRANLFGSFWSCIVTVLGGLLLIYWGWDFVSWAVLHAVWSVPTNSNGPDTDACHNAQGTGACWAVIGEKYRLILFGRYPYHEQWRPSLSILLFMGLYACSAWRRMWRRELALIWLVTLIFIALLMWGGLLGLTYVPQEQWGGLPLTLTLATFGLAFAFPVAVVVALGRRSKELPALRILCILYVELIRGVPLITVLFMSSVVFPLFLPDGVSIDKLLRAQVAIIFFTGAYLAEVIRGGLQALPKGQYEAADALGLSYWKKTRLIILPQALRLVIPPLVNTFIGSFKDTSLVLIIGLLDLLSAGRIAVNDPAWIGYSTEVYLFLALIYFLFCYVMARYSRKLEQQYAQHHDR